MDLAVPAGGLEEATMSPYRHKGLLIDVAYVAQSAATYLQRGRATNDGIAALLLPRRAKASTALAQNTCLLMSVFSNLQT